MCGVIGFVGDEASPEFFYNGLKRLEYRGYDSAGIAMLSHGQMYIERAEGKLSALEKKLVHLPLKTSLGMGHTRWATHGKPSEANAHPHKSGNIVILHNGIIENYKEIKSFLQENGYVFESETDTEVAAHLLHYEFHKNTILLSPLENMKRSIFALVSRIRGAFAFGIICTDIPDVLFAVKYGSPLVLGLSDTAHYMASGIAALVEHTRSILIMEDREIAYLTAKNKEIVTFEGVPVSRKPIHVSWAASMLEKNGYDHFMLKEIHEQPQAIAQTINGRIDKSTGEIDLQSYGIHHIPLKNINRIQLIACGTSYYAGILARYFLESHTKIPVEVELASEYRYRTCTVNEHTLCIAISQSGETIDTLQAIRYARTHGAHTLAVVNAPGSSIAHHCHDESLIYAGPEVGVASTKAFVAQVTSLIILGLGIAQTQNIMTSTQIAAVCEQLVHIPYLVEKTLSLSSSIEKMAAKLIHLKSVLFIGRGPQYPVALEGALKLKELSYIHAEAYAAGELKHGPIALIDDEMYTVCLAPRDSYYEKTMSNIEEIRARGGKIISIGTTGDHELKQLSDEFIEVEPCAEMILPFLTTVPLHLLAYWIALKKGHDVDQPRNLAKSVTVE